MSQPRAGDTSATAPRGQPLVGAQQPLVGLLPLFCNSPSWAHLPLVAPASCHPCNSPSWAAPRGHAAAPRGHAATRVHWPHAINTSHSRKLLAQLAGSRVLTHSPVCYLCTHTQSNTGAITLRKKGSGGWVRKVCGNCKQRVSEQEIETEVQAGHE